MDGDTKRKIIWIVFIWILLDVLVLFSFRSCFGFVGSGGAYGKNITSVSVSGSTVSFKIKCPSCSHVDLGTFKETLEKGETCNNTARCLECGRKYPISITRR